MTTLSFKICKNHLLSIAEQLNAKWGAGTVELCITDQYYNMKNIIEQNIHLIENAKSACERVGLIPNVSPIRGGTDGCRLSFRGLPCPDIGTGAHAYHGPYEHISAQSMDKSCRHGHRTGKNIFYIFKIICLKDNYN